MDMKVTLKRLVLMIILFSMSVLFNPLFAQQGRIYSKNHHLYTDCYPCRGLIIDYNDVMSEIAQTEQTLAEIQKSIEEDQRFIQQDDARIASIESMPPSPKKTEELNTAQRVKNNDLRDLKNHQAEAQTYSQKLSKLGAEIDEILWDLDDCEDFYCGHYYQNEYGLFNYLSRLIWTLTYIQMGYMIGNLNGSQTAHFNELIEKTFNRDPSGSHSVNQPLFGIQLELLLGDPNRIRPTLILNGEKTTNPANKLISQRFSPTAPGNVVVTLHNNWILRALFGLESPLFYHNRFSAGVSAGVGRLNQSLDTTIAGVAQSKSQSSNIPSLAASLTYYACPNCLLGYPLLISGQVIADRYPDFTGNGTTVNQKWQYNENLIFSIGLEKPCF